MAQSKIERDTAESVNNQNNLAEQQNSEVKDEVIFVKNNVKIYIYIYINILIYFHDYLLLRSFATTLAELFRAWFIYLFMKFLFFVHSIYTAALKITYIKSLLRHHNLTFT